MFFGLLCCQTQLTKKEKRMELSIKFRREQMPQYIYIFFDKRTDATISLIKKFQLPIVRTCLKEK